MCLHARLAGFLVTSHHATHANCLWTWRRETKKCHGDTSPLIWLLVWCTIFSCSVFTFRAAAFSSALVQHTYLSLPSAIWTTGWRWKLGNRTPSLFRISQQYNMRGNGKSDNEYMSTKLRTICILVHHVWTGVHKDFPLSFHLSLAHSENPFYLISFPYLKQITVDQCFTTEIIH